MLSTQEPIEKSTLLSEIRALVADEMRAIAIKMREEATSSVPLTEEITQHILQAKGKQLRPLLMVLAARAAADQPNKKLLDPALKEMAVVIEFVHTATLLHDDVVDVSALRRGKSTANNLWGNAASVLVGDFLYSRAFQILARHQNTQIMHLLAKTTNAIAEGEVLQLMNRNDTTISEEKYFHVITQKTAQLFSAATQIGAILAGAKENTANIMAEYGLLFGIAFQLIDDLLDYQASTKDFGKNIGDDLREGKVTLPLIYAMQTADKPDALFIESVIRGNQPEQFDRMLSILQATSAFAKTKEKAREYAQIARKALNHLQPSSYRDALLSLLAFATNRSH
ncbi:MAG: hypothetical protein A3E84_03305 [Gammaproteobacteria bacterium RIFCSPHIGHO2_12_FULL_42_13]|nr:MAG: hypothetical protein A3E84_03305 [Gammaproteobacteria bacterium RIFCSPHIGHO2_12_FULL_42_13]